MNEFQRRVLQLEKKILPSVVCKHRLPVLINATDDEIDRMYEELADCPNCRTPRLSTPSMFVLRITPSVSENS